MKKLYTFLFILSVTSSVLMSQDRYLDEVFTDVTVTQNVVYGTNGTILFIAQEGEIVPQPLIMDVYEPAGDTEVDRPLVLMFHTGNFLPNVVNGQISGTLRDSAMVEMCTQLARRGYVAASVDYRAGWNPLAGSQPERAVGLIQAAYRGVQDGRNAVRYMRSNMDTWGIDPDKITMWGNGTGGYLTLGTVGLSDYNEIPGTTNGPAKFVLDLFIGSPADGMQGQDGIPDTPMVIEAFHGDINGEVLTVTPADGSSAGFGLPPGDTTNYVNFAGVDNSFALQVNVGGALGDISWLNDNTTPTISIQSAFDQFAPYEDAVLVVPTTQEPVVRVQGAQLIGEAQESAGLNAMWKDAIFTDAITQEAIGNSATAGHPYYEGVFPWIKPVNSNGIDEGVVIDWWDPNAPSPANGPGMGAPWNMLPHPSGGTFDSNGELLNENQSAEKARANIADIFSYVLPRACVALELPCAANFLDTSTDEILVDAGMIISPNPASQSIYISTDADFMIGNLEIYSMDGKMLRNFSNLNTNSFNIERNGLANGIYIIKAIFEEGIQTSKVVFE